MTTWQTEQDWYQALALRVLRLLAERQLTIYRLSVLSGVSFYQASRYLRESRRMPAYALFRFARALGVPVSDLVGDSQQPAQRSFDFD